MKRTIYTPLTAVPFGRSSTYREVPPRNPELAGCIRCFWGSEKPYFDQEKTEDRSLVTPDTCVDIIYEIDHTANTVTGCFCGINDASFSTRRDAAKGHLVSDFAIRFFGWSAYPFSEDSLKGTVNGFCEVEVRFSWLDRSLRQQLFEKTTLEERAKITEELLLQRLQQHMRRNPVVDEAICQMVSRKGALSAAELSRECCISGRQLERLFHEYIGMTPKKLGNLVRYQFLWNEIVRNPAFSVLDGVYKYGYTDQSHLLREFKRYHTMDIRRAREYACHVGNIQYSLDRI